jgi:hypothetical protein
VRRFPAVATAASAQAVPVAGARPRLVRTAVLVLLLSATAVAVAACSDPYATTSTTAAPTRSVEIAQRTHEYPGTAPAPQQHGAGAPTPQAALIAFAQASMNWNWTSLAAQQRQLAVDAVDQAREHAQLLATTAAHDTEMRRGQITSTGTVQTIARIPGSRGRWLVVTLEQSGSAHPGAFDRPRAAYHVTVAAVREIAPGRWAVSAWHPQV